jgi:hypothetical protein
MHDRTPNTDLLERQPHLASIVDRLAADKDKSQNTDEDSCSAFGYLRGNHERALALEFRFRNGNRAWFPYSWLGPWQYHPSTGLLIKFTGDLVTLVLIRGSNLDMHLPQNAMNLTDRGLQRHRILWIREMEPEELRKTGEQAPTIDRIDIAEFATHEEMCEWLKSNGPAFLRMAYRP